MNKKAACFAALLVGITAASYAQENLSKLIEGLLFGSATRGVFQAGEQIDIPLGLLRVIDFDASQNRYLVEIADNQASVLAPFYIVSARRLNLMNLHLPNVIFEDLAIEFIGYGDYLQNRAPRETYTFRLVK
ncbi:MAG: hypothetical protein FWE09_02975 [Treponema sp.]|nr:hypothetical protein [Treponema sp.]